MTYFKDYNNTVDTLKQLGTNHYQIKTITTGDLWEIDLDKNSFMPLMHINPINAVAGTHQMTLNFQIFIMDLVFPDQSNEQEVLSDCLQICNDLIGTFKNGESLFLSNEGIDELPKYFTEGDITIEPFTERFDNSVTGWVFTLPVIIENEYNTCIAPQATTDAIH
tara:strand:+ start:1592 stop:2086 length:495 start_codon:yes stop_codon:yes gene_type:complete